MGYLTFQIARLAELLLVVIGAHLAISVGGIFFFGFTVPYLASAYAIAILAQAGFSVGGSIMLALLVALTLGFFYAFLYRRLSQDSFAVFSVASILAFDALVRSWDSFTGGVLGIAGISGPAFVSSFSNLVLLGVIVAATCLLLEYILLQTRYGFALQAHKENKHLLDASGLSATRVGMSVVVLASVLAGLAGILAIWRVQYLDPTFGDVQYLILFLTAGVLAFKPKVRWVLGSSIFVIFLPELLTFLPFPSSILGHLRSLTYAVLLIITIFKLSRQSGEQKRLV